MECKYVRCMGQGKEFKCTLYFYRWPITGTKIKFSKQVVGINRLGSYIKDMMYEAGFKGNYTGHSGNVTTATTLYHKGVDEQLILERTCYRSDAIRA
jgi:hypothetical protein